MQAASPDIHPSTLLKGSLTCTDLPSILEPIDLTGETLNPWYKGKSLVWDMTVVHTFAPSQYVASATNQAVKQLMMRPKNAENTMTSLTIITFNQLQLKPLLCMVNSLLLCWAVLQRNLLISQVIPGSDHGSTCACPCLWSEGMLPAYWPVCMFHLNWAILSILSSVAARHLPLSSMNSYCLLTVCIFCRLYCLLYVLRFL